MGGCACALCIGIERLTAVLFMNHYRRLSGSLLTVSLLIKIPKLPHRKYSFFHHPLDLNYNIRFVDSFTTRIWLRRLCRIPHDCLLSANVCVEIMVNPRWIQLSRQLICAIPAPFHGAAAALWGRTLGALILSTIAVYCTVAAIISKRAEGCILLPTRNLNLLVIFDPSLAVSSATRKSFRSIFFVMTSDVSGWAITIGLLHVSAAIDITG